MIRKSLTQENKSNILIAANIVGDVWSILIIKELLEKKYLRFNEIQEKVIDICPRTLSHRLDKLRQQGIINKEIMLSGQPFTEYSLTALGKEASSVIAQIEVFGGYIMKNKTNTL